MTHDACNITAGCEGASRRSLLNPSFIAETRDLMKAATEGPWEVNGPAEEMRLNVENADYAICAVFADLMPEELPAAANAAFIAHSRQALPLVLDAYEEAVRLLEAVVSARHLMSLPAQEDAAENARAFLASQKEG